mmetsp:Transcript_5824/g.8432  ORF Transcript_5824/g.8432 Transcript_5824/m.8432 type:complete len:83 (+) Transcript_5824:401-649(+)
MPLDPLVSLIIVAFIENHSTRLALDKKNSRKDVKQGVDHLGSPNNWGFEPTVAVGIPNSNEEPGSAIRTFNPDKKNDNRLDK